MAAEPGSERQCADYIADRTPLTASNSRPPASAGLPEFLALLEQGSDWHLVSDRAGRITWANRTFLKAVAHSNLVVGQELVPFIGGDPPSPAGDPHVRAALLAALLREDVFDESVTLVLPTEPQPVPLRLRITSCADLRLWTMTDLRVERSLGRRLQRLGELLDTVQEFGRLGAWERDIATGEGNWDRHMFRFLGVDPAAGTPSFAEATRNIHPEDIRSEEFSRSIRQVGSYSQRFRVLRPDGGMRWLHSQWKIMPGADGKPVRAVGVMVDDTEAVATAHSLDEATAKLAFAVELGEIVIFEHDLHSSRVHLNARGLQMLGLPDDSEGIPVAEMRKLIHPDDRAQDTASFRAAMGRPGPVDMQIRYRSSDGRWQHILSRRVLQRDALDRPERLVGVAMDVSERVEKEFAADQALAQARDRIALATQGAGIGTWELELAGELARWDPQMYVLRGLPVPADCETSGPRQPWTAGVHPDDLPRIVAAHQRSLRDGSMAGYEFRAILADGTLRWLAARSMPVFDGDGKASRVLGVNWDVHERVVAEEIRREAQAAQRRSDAKSALLAQMSHELRTPLNAILGFTQLLAVSIGTASDSGPTDPAATGDRSQMLAHIRRAAEQLLELVDEVLDLSTVRPSELSLKLQPVELEPLLRTAVASIGSRAPARAARVRVLAPQSPIRAVANEPRLRQVLTKLIDRQLSASDPASAVELAIVVEGTEARIRISLLTGQQAGARQAQLFDRLSDRRRDEASPAVADLATFDTRLAVMGGRVETLATDESGPRLQVCLPLAEPRAAPAAATRCNARVLYIEDNPVNVILVQELIAQRPGKVDFRSETTGLAGVDRASVFLPDLILIDIHLPDIDGFEVLRRLREHLPTRSTCCVALSANAIPEDIERAKAAGFDDYWTKPIRFGPFLAGLDRLLPSPGTAGRCDVNG